MADRNSVVSMADNTIIALSLIHISLSPEMGNNKGGGLSGLAASFLGSGVSMGCLLYTSFGYRNVP